MKYVDAEKLKELLDAKYKEFTEKAKKDCPLQYQYMADGLDIAEQFIDSLQQEQPEVDLEKEVRKYCDSSFRFNYDEFNDSFYSNAFEFDDVVELARHFYELGLNARKEK